MENNKFAWCAIIIGGLAIIVNGALGRSMSNDVEMPYTKQELENPKPPTRSSRIAYIAFGMFLIVYGLWKCFVT